MAPPRHRPKGFGRTAGGSWEIGMDRMPAFVPGDDGAPIRPVIVLVMDPSGRIRAMATGHPDRPVDGLQQALREAIEAPAVGCTPAAPEAVVVPSPQLEQMVRPLLPGVAIRVGPTPLLEEALASLQQHFEEEPPPQETLAMRSYLTEDVTAADVASFFEAAAALYERKPWLVFPSDSHLFQVSSTALGIRGWVGSVIGQAEEHYGVILFDSLADFERFVQVGEYAEREGAHPRDGFPYHRAINFEARSAMPESLLKEIEHHHWPVARGDGYPTVMMVEPDLVLAPPTQADLRQLEGVARALVRLIDDVPDLPRRWQDPRPLRKRFRVVTQGKELAITIGVVEEFLAEDAGPEETPTNAPPSDPGSPPTESSPPESPPPGPAGKERVPAAMQAKVDSLMNRIDGFCDDHLNAEYRQLIHKAVCALARKRPSPLLTGREPSWCTGLVHAIGMANFLFDRSQTPHCRAPEIYAYFGVSAPTGQAHSRKVRDLLRISMFEPKWTLPSRLDDSPMAWMLEVNGLMVDIRTMPIEVQLQACAKGLIPYVPALRDAAEGE